MITRDQYVDFLIARITVGEQAFRLASGATSRVKVDLEDLLMASASRSLVADYAVASISLFKDDAVVAIGGPGFGANPIAAAIAERLGISWFSRDKDGTWRGAPEPGQRVVVVDDVVTSGGSTLRVVDPLLHLGVDVVGVTALLDRAGVASEVLAHRGVAFEPLAIWSDIGLDRVELPEDLVSELVAAINRGHPAT